MKICQNCGKEYGDDNSFCPFCDERYGTVILVDDVISADGLPPYKEEFSVIGEVSVKQESFAANREDIFDRNTRLAEIENLLPKVEVKKVYKPVVPLVQIDGNGSIAPYVSSAPVVKKVPQKNKKNFNGVKKSICVLVGIYFVYLFFIWVARLSGELNNEHVYYPYETYVHETYVYGNGIPVPEDITITSESGLEMKLFLEYKLKNRKYYKYRFEIINTTDKEIDNIFKEFAGLEYTDKFYYMTYHNNYVYWVDESVYWNDGIPDIADSSGSTVISGGSVSGEAWLDFSES